MAIKTLSGASCDYIDLKRSDLSLIIEALEWDTETKGRQLEILEVLRKQVANKSIVIKFDTDLDK